MPASRDKHRPRAIASARGAAYGSTSNVPVVSMANQRDTFAKRRREQGLQDRAREKLQRRADRRNDSRPAGSGPQIAWDEAVRAVVTEDAETPADPPTQPASGDDPPT